MPAARLAPEPAAGQDGSGEGVRAVAGAAQGLLLPGAGDQLRRAVPLPLRQELWMAARRLVCPERAPLTDKVGWRLRNVAVGESGQE